MGSVLVFYCCVTTIWEHSGLKLPFYFALNSVSQESRKDSAEWFISDRWGISYDGWDRRSTTKMASSLICSTWSKITSNWCWLLAGSSAGAIATRTLHVAWASLRSWVSIQRVHPKKNNSRRTGQKFQGFLWPCLRNVRMSATLYCSSKALKASVDSREGKTRLYFSVEKVAKNLQPYLIYSSPQAREKKQQI